MASEIKVAKQESARLNAKPILEVLTNYQQGLGLMRQAGLLLTSGGLDTVPDQTARSQALQLRTQALQSFTAAAQQGHAGSLLHLGFFYAAGYDVVRIDAKKSRQCFESAARKGLLEAVSRFAFCLADECSFLSVAKVESAVRLWRNSSDHYFSAMNLGAAHLFRWGPVEVDKQQATLWFQHSLSGIRDEIDNNGNLEALIGLALCFHNGYGIPQDHTKGTELYMIAAAAGHAFAQFHLAECYRRGLGLSKDVKKAMQFFAMSGKQGYGMASLRLGEMHFNGEGGIPKDLSKAEELLNFALQQSEVHDVKKKAREVLAQVRSAAESQK